MILTKKDLDERYEINPSYLAESLEKQVENVLSVSTATISVNPTHANTIELVLNGTWTYDLVITDFTATLYNHDGENILVAVADDSCDFEDLLAINVINTIMKEL